MSKRKFEISFDEERINQFNEYTSEALYDTLDEIMSYHHVTKTAKGVYEGDNANDFIGLYFYLYDLNWFMNYVGKWYSYHDGGMEDVIKSVNIKERQIANEFR